MKNIIFIIIVVVLIGAVSVIRIKINKLGKTQTDGAQISLTDVNIPDLPEFILPPKNILNTRPSVSADSIVLIDGKTFYPLWQKNADKKVSIASTTKIMTAIIILENYNLNDIIEVSQKAATQIGSETFLKTGEKLTVESLLKATLIQSGNDAAYALAEKMGVDNFVNKMNMKALDLGLKNTEFKDPAGLDDNGHSSAFDLAVISAYALNNSKFAEIVKTPEAIIYSVDGRFEHRLENSNRLIKGDNLLYLPYVIGVKTGFTPAAGHCLVSAGNKNGRRLISVILNTAEYTVEASAKESRKLLQWGFDDLLYN